ncbi:MAG: ATP-grasp domain-containing protein [Anaerolineales bacterium]|nr:ATP-grasp domain-containing protein [Anaerolineales bacterium]
MKKILLLGAATFQIPPIQYALDRGYYVVTCDNVPQNPGHKLSHKSFNVSTTDMDGILSIARQESIDGIMTFGSDVSAPTAAYVSEKMELPGNPIESVQMLTNKAKFRAFLSTTGIQPLEFRSFPQPEMKSVQDYIGGLELPVVIKPVDAAGSKGVSILYDLDQIENQVKYAFENSMSGHIVIEKYIQKMGKQVCGDGFVLNGDLVFIEFGDGYFYDDGEYLAPYAESFPSTHQVEHLAKVREKLQSIIRASGFRRGPFNFDVLITPSGEPFIIEIGPRSGGNFIPRAIHLNTGVNVVAAAVETCLNWDYQFPEIPTRQDKFYACYMIHSRKSGMLKKVAFSDEIVKNIFEVNMYLDAGSPIHPFHKANSAIGNIILQFDAFDEMQEKMKNMQQYCFPELENNEID